MMYSPAPNKSHLVKGRAPIGLLTSRCETDCRNALLRGLAEYLEQLKYVAPGGREHAFVVVGVDSGSSDMPARFPAALVTAGGDARYAPRNTANTITARDEVESRIGLDGQLLPEGIGLYAMVPATVTLDATIEVWASSEEGRMWLVKMLEDALDPQEGIGGFKLELPHYHGVRGGYNSGPKTCRYEVQAGASREKLFKAYIGITCDIEQVVLVERVRIVGTVLGLKVSR